MTELSKHNPTNRFSGLAEVYAKSRPSYPSDAIEFILSHCGLTTDSTVVDIGAGTGISSRLLAAQGPTVIGVEPNDDMRAQAESESLDCENLSFLKGTAEETLLLDNVADAVLCAQAFHWFRAEESLAEFKRILKPSGWTVLMWNERYEKDAFTKTYGDLLRELPETLAVELPRGRAGQALLDTKTFSNQEVKHFTNQQIMDEEGLIGRAFSASYAPKEKDVAEQFTVKLRSLFKEFAQDGTVTLTYETSVYVGESK
ncbi:class I SAM-dependent methyltransferase [soil metagenome]